jgi:hypothetical protein
MQQLALTGEDWKSDREKSREARARGKREHAGRVGAQALLAATKAISTYLQACRDCNDGSGDERSGIADCRHRLIGDMSEYAAWLQSKHGG